MRVGIALVGLLVLSSCAQRQQQEQFAEQQQIRADAQRIYDNDVQICNEETPSNEANFRTIRENCKAPAFRRFGEAVGFNSVDVEYEIAERVDLASRIDSGQITPEQANLLYAQFNEQQSYRLTQQNAENAELRMQQQQVNDQSLQTTYGIINQLQQNNLRQQQLNYQNNMAVVQQPIQTYNPPSQSNCTSTVVGQYVQTHCY
jgi:FtsZ-interacting cell division protein ZipA